MYSYKIKDLEASFKWVNNKNEKCVGKNIGSRYFNLIISIMTHQGLIYPTLLLISNQILLKFNLNSGSNMTNRIKMIRRKESSNMQKMDQLRKKNVWGRGIKRGSFKGRYWTFNRVNWNENATKKIESELFCWRGFTCYYYT